jgi:DNA-directed RNA polymerase alpha subunit
MTKQPDDLFAGGWPKSMGRPARQALTAHGIDRLEQLTEMSAAELLDLHGVGPKAVAVLRQTLAERGLAFRDDSGS